MQGTCKPELESRQDPPVARYDPVPAVHEDRVGESELLHRRRDLPDLLRRVGPGVAGVGDQRLERAVIDGQMLQEGPLEVAGATLRAPDFRVFPDKSDIESWANRQPPRVTVFEEARVSR